MYDKLAPIHDLRGVVLRASNLKCTGEITPTDWIPRSGHESSKRSIFVFRLATSGEQYTLVVKDPHCTVNRTSRRRCNDTFSGSVERDADSVRRRWLSILFGVDVAMSLG